jgi:hypothetical protein
MTDASIAALAAAATEIDLERAEDVRPLADALVALAFENTSPAPRALSALAVTAWLTATHPN